ncbi:hypothetical protein LEMA_P003070.1 [Plenodomus lingam JN3]|uniref:20S-pre-rRNA D-site endonuclease NOB1 n=2 Tax=Leptosphaeria maculans TaxID=5022 RepID=E5AE81_LEPMJ|nr:hypothetical protein LEMA_P003070.1 [Plenodomus lingam JN3]CBY01520.1 hypothetical protein LEMA_P003070.1 [Plenodomus lingam JN3]
MATPGAGKKPIHSLILDTGPLIKNTVSISTIINAAEELYTTPAILSEIRDEATRSRVQTTLVPFLKIRNPSPASYDAVIAFSKKTGDYPVLSRQDLGILALAYEVHCERNGGDYGLRAVPKGPIKRREGEEEPEEEKEPKEKKKRNRRNKVAGKEEEEAAEVPAEDEGWEQPKGKRATKARAAKPVKFKYEAAQNSKTQEVQDQQSISDGTAAEATGKQDGVAIVPETLKEQNTVEQPDVQANMENTVNANSETVILSENITNEPQSTDAPADNLAEQLEATTISEPTVKEAQPAATEQHSEEPFSEPDYEEVYDATDSDSEAEPEHIATAEEIAAHNTANPLPVAPRATSSITTQQPTPPHSDHASDDSDGDWITPSNLPVHQVKDSILASSLRTTPTPQTDVATMTIDFAMQNVLLQMNLHLLSTNLQRIKTIKTKVLRCHACFFICHDTAKTFCPRCGQPSLTRVSCSTNANGAFTIHLSRNYQYNKRGDRFSVPKPIAGTANGKWKHGQGGGKGGWGRELIFAEDQKEFEKKMVEEKRRRVRDGMDGDFLPGLLTGERSAGGSGRVRVGGGKNVNARKR